MRCLILMLLLLVSQTLHSATLPPLPAFHAEDFGAPCNLVTDIQEGTCDLKIGSVSKSKHFHELTLLYVTFWRVPAKSEGKLS